MKTTLPNSIPLRENEQGGALKRLMSDGANAWGFSQNNLLLIWTIPVLIVLGAVIAALLGKPAYKWYTGEDQFAETMQVLIYISAFVLNFYILSRLWVNERKIIASLYLFVLFGLIFMIGEELSWGQRLIGWETSETFEEINKQQETNLHNIYGVGDTFKWLQMVVGAYGAILPLFMLKLGFFKKNQVFFSYVIPHYTLIPFFLPMLIWRLYRNLFDAPAEYYFAISEFNEVIEFILAAGVALFMFFQFRRLRASGSR